MKLGVDLSCLSEHWAGVQFYTSNFIRALSLSFDGSLDLFHYSDIRNYPKVYSDRHRFREIQTRFRSRVIREQVVLPLRILGSNNLDRLLVPAYLGPIKVSVPVDLIVYDLLFLRDDSGLSYKQRCYWEGLYQRAFDRADRLFPCSKSTGVELIRRFPEYRDKIGSALYPALRKFGQTETRPDQVHFEDPYILFVGTISPRKNVNALIKWFRRAREEQFSEYDLRIVGQHGWGEPKPEQLRKLGDGIYWHESVPDSRLYRFYDQADLLCLPSRGEGFGMPILEAFESRTPVILSDLDVFREVAGAAAFYIHLDDKNQWDEVFERALRDERARRRKLTLGKRRLRDFSWAKTANRYLQDIGYE